MNLLQNLLKTIQLARTSNNHLTHLDTLSLLTSIKEISADKSLLNRVIQLVFISEDKDFKVNNLSKRQTQIFIHIGLGFSSREIGDLLQITEATVSTHRKQIIKKLGMSGPGKLLFMATLHIQNKLYG